MYSLTLRALTFTFEHICMRPKHQTKGNSGDSCTILSPWNSQMEMVMRSDEKRENKITPRFGWQVSFTPEIQIVCS